MATAPPVVPQRFDFDGYSTTEDIYYEASVNRPSASTGYAHEALGVSLELKMAGKRPRILDQEQTSPEAASMAEDEGRKKRARGRPRMDTKDETAVERRRTQIRLAQRAYRHRKDTAITALEQRVKELERANDDMSKDFNDFYGVLLSERILDAAPHAVVHLSAIANKLMSAAARARTGESDGSGSDCNSPDRDASRDASRDARPPSYEFDPPALSNTPPGAPSPSSPPAPPVIQSGVQQQGANYTVTVAAAGGPGAAPMTALGHVNPGAPFRYQVVKEPTSQNASFPFHSSMESSAMGGVLQQIGLAVPSPYNTIASPVSYSGCEVSFGRRLQRVTVERALRLITMSSPPPERFAAVFGFCLFFETKADIISRLELALSRNQVEDLNHWKAPFTNLGGAGTFFPDQPSAPAEGVANARPHTKPRPANGMSMGPWGAEVQTTRAQQIDYGADQRMRMMLVGFEGDFFDPDEVEAYLRQFGIFIPQRADFVEADVNLDALNAESQLSIPTPHPSMYGPKTQLQQPSIYDGSDSGYGGSAHNATWTTSSMGTIVADANQASYECGEAAATMVPIPVPVPVPVPVSDVNTIRPPQAASWYNSVKVTLNVSVLIQELTKFSVCLGRTPGVRKKDIGRAVQVAAGLVPMV